MYYYVVFCQMITFYTKNTTCSLRKRLNSLFDQSPSIEFQGIAQENALQGQPTVFPNYNNIQMIQCHQGNKIMHCESTQLANSSQNVTANQANLTEALQFVQAEQREMLGSHQTVEC